MQTPNIVALHIVKLYTQKNWEFFISMRVPRGLAWKMPIVWILPKSAGTAELFEYEQKVNRKQTTDKNSLRNHTLLVHW